MKTIINIPEIRDALKEYKNLKRIANKSRNRLNTLFKKYDFVNKVYSETVGDTELEEVICELLNSIGYNAKQPTENRNFDVIASYLGNKLGIEVKNTKNIVGENELLQASKYLLRNLNTNNKLNALIIWNNARTDQGFDNFRIEDARNHNYGILTTSELLKGFFKLKSQRIDINTFNQIIRSIGLIEFSEKEIEKVESSVTER